MNWYIAICSLITGFALGAFVVKWAKIDTIADTQQEFIRIFIKNNDARNEQLTEIFNTERQILLTLISKATKKVENNQ